METKDWTLRQINELVGGQLEGDSNIVIKGVSGIKDAKEGDITFLANSKYEFLLKSSGASAVIVSRQAPKAPSKPLIRVENPSLAFSKVVSFMFPEEKRFYKGIHPSAVLGSGVKLGKEVSLGPHVVVEDEVQIGDNTVICAGTFVGFRTRIGSGTLIYPNVTMREKAVVGDRVIIHSGTVIGSDGFGFEEIEGRRQKIPQVGIVVIEDDVEIGACVTIDRARFGRTLISRGTKIDNLVQIAHNVVVGEDSVIVAQAGISGSSVLGKNVILAGQSGIVGHVKLGDNVIVGAQSGVTKSVPNSTFIVGSPAKPHNESKKIFAAWSKLPALLKEVSELKERVDRLTRERAKGGKAKDNKKRD
ncbi:MAG: UDP-3-O-(3-hydroxymyristoyl)glucosamine N-acyltransferase [Candidatus Omnitrophica bacterium]|nr:UDP-3-O-(3-hydroxymyristoyl)glucosamine N-acyltransferase [Candidatus Omnitrophota bacterium]